MNLFPLSLIGFGIFLFFVVIFSYFFLDPEISYLAFIDPPHIQNRLFLTSIYIFCICGCIFFSLFFMRRLYKKQSQKGLFQKILLFLLILLFSYPAMLSYDIYNYIATSKVTFLYLENPYIVMPIEFSTDPLITFMHAANKTALYGPVWILLTAVPFFLGFNNFVATLLLFKTIIILFYFATVVLLLKMTKDSTKVALFALHPLVIIETFIGSHNDIVMMFLALLSFFMLKEKRVLLAIFFLLASFLIKYATFALIPIFVYAVYRIVVKKPIDWGKVYKYGFISMFFIFLLSFFREEIYPWYAIWFLVFLPFLNLRKYILTSIYILTISLLFRYVPYLVTGSHFGITPYAKWIITFVPVLFYLVFQKSKNVWLRQS